MNLSAATLTREVSSTADQALLQDLEKLASIVNSKGHVCRPYSPLSLAKLSDLTEEKKQTLASQVRSVLQIISMTSPQIDFPNDDHPERSWVEQAFKTYDLELRHDYWSKLQKDDVIEVYSMENIQLFRTFNFFKISSYSILDLLTNEWYHLWERPSFVLQSLIQVSHDIFGGVIQNTTQVKISKHMLKEIYNDASINFKCASVLVEPGLICPLYSKGSDEVKGFVFSLRGTVISYDNEADKIAMI